MEGEGSSHLHNSLAEEEEDGERGMTSPGDLSALGGARVAFKMSFSWESKPEINRRPPRYKCPRLSAGRVAAHINCEAMKKVQGRGAGIVIRLSYRTFIPTDSRRRAHFTDRLVP